jgi:hypothetical protein
MQEQPSSHAAALLPQNELVTDTVQLSLDYKGIPPGMAA